MKNIFAAIGIFLALSCCAMAQNIPGPGPALGPCTAFGTTAGTCLQGASALGTPTSGNAANLTNSSLVSGDVVLATTSGVLVTNALYSYNFTNHSFILTAAGSDTVVGGPNLEWNNGTGTVELWQLGATNQLCLWGNPGTFQTNLCSTEAGVISMPHLSTSSAAQTGTVCSGTGGVLSVDTTTTCLLSLEEYKNIRAGINPFGAIVTAWRLRPIWFTYKPSTPEGKVDKLEQPGLGARATAAVDKRLAGYDPQGKLRGVRYQELSAFLVAAVNGHTILIALLAAWNVVLTLLAMRKRKWA